MIAGDVNVLFGVGVDLKLRAMLKGIGEDFIDESDPFLEVLLVGKVSITFFELEIVSFKVFCRHCSRNQDFIELSILDFDPGVSGTSANAFEDFVDCLW